MLHDPARLTALLLDPQRPVQLIIAGKAHPADDGGKRLIQQMVQFADDPAVRHRIVFLPDYDMAMARALTAGCDVWLNNPLRPLEACGTSGMKSALNGGLNLSVRDGWWDEWFDGENGWAIPSADDVADAGRRAAAAVAGDGRAHPRRARAPGAGGPNGLRIRGDPVRARRPGVPCPGRRRRGLVQAGPRTGRVEAAGQGGLAGRPDRAHRGGRRGARPGGAAAGLGQ